MGLKTLVRIMALLIIIITDSLAQVPIFLTRWPIAATIIIISRHGLSRIDFGGRGEALRLRAAGAAIATIFIAPTLLVVLARSLGFVGLEAMKKHGSCLVGVKCKRTLVPDVILNRFQGGAVAPWLVSIHLADPEKKVQGGLGLSRDSHLNGLVLDVFSTTFLLGLGMNRRP